MSNDAFLTDIEVLSIPEQIANSIKEAILKGKLKPGEMIPSQQELAKRLGVSRPTVRKALQHLVEAQLVVAVKGRYGGYKVADFDPDKVVKNLYEKINLFLAFQSISPWDLFEVRKMIEIPSVALAAERRTEEDLAQLESCLSRIDLENQEIQDIIDADLKFHFLLSKCTHNPLAQTFMQAIIMTFQKNPLKFSIEHKHHIVKGLPEVLEAIRLKNPRESVQAMETHLNYSKNIYQLAHSSTKSDRPGKQVG